MVDWKELGWRDQARDIRACLEAVSERIPKRDVEGRAALFQAREMLLFLCQKSAGAAPGVTSDDPWVNHYHHIRGSLADGQLRSDTLAWMFADLKMQSEVANSPKGNKILAIKAVRTRGKLMLEQAVVKLKWGGTKHLPVISLRDAKQYVDNYIARGSFG